MANVPVQRTWTVGDLVTAAEMNANVRDAVNFLLGGGSAGNKPSFYGYAAAAQSVPNATQTRLTLTIAEDTDSGWDATNTQYVVKTAGRFLVTAYLAWAANSTGVRQGVLNIAGNEQALLTVSAGVDNTGRCPLVWSGRLATNQVLFFAGFQNSGAALNASAGFQCRLTIDYLGS